MSATVFDLVIIKLTAHSLDVGTRQLVFSHDELLEVNVIRERHSRSMELEDMSLGLGIGKGEFWGSARLFTGERQLTNLSVYTSRSDKSWI
jgi:hypothetical protein